MTAQDTLDLEAALSALDDSIARETSRAKHVRLTQVRARLLAIHARALNRADLDHAS